MARHTHTRRAVMIATACAICGLWLAPAAQASPRVGAFRGLGSWVDIYDTGLRADPEATVAQLQSDGAQTLYLETSNYHSSSAIVAPSIVARFIVAAHAGGIRVVAWYLPSLGRPALDRWRSLAAIRYRTSGGQRFDAFALDIESTAVADPAVRSARLVELSTAIRTAAVSGYPLGAIVPAPAAMRDRPGYWPGFPFRALRSRYDVFLPMDYFTYHVTGPVATHDYTAGNIRLLRSATGDPSLPIHVIGGIADASSLDQVTAFVHAEREAGVLGASLYDDATTSPAQWAQLASVPSNPLERPALPLDLPVAAALGNIPGGDRSHPKEVFYRAAGATGSFAVSYRGFDIQAGEVELWVNWQFVRTLRPTAAGSWSGARHPAIPAGLLYAHRRNLIQFVAVGNAPAWSVWGVRSVSMKRTA